VAKTIDLELTRAEVEVIELSDALKAALVAKKERLAKLRTLHAAAGRPNRVPEDPNKPLPLHATRRPPLKRSVPQRPKAKTTK
jgi:hypothetical protein